MQQQQVEKIIAAIRTQRPNYKSDRAQSRALGMSQPQYSLLMKGGVQDQVVSEAKLVGVAMKLGVNLTAAPDWQAVRTYAFDYVHTQLQMCQETAVAALLVDIPDVGKTFAAQHYCRSHRNAVYVDCSQYKSKQRLVRHIAKGFGAESEGRYQDVYQGLIYLIQSLEQPLIVLDEAGDLDYPAFLELKALWNATERSCGWYMMGADGLKAKVLRNIGSQKVGYAEIYSRFGTRFQKITPDGSGALGEFKQQAVAKVLKLNAPALDPRQVYNKTGGSLRRVFIEVQKMRKQTAHATQASLVD